jgi:ATP-dependent Clp protease adaptor protein ClpS
MDREHDNFEDYIKGLFDESFGAFSEEPLHLQYPVMYNVIIEDVLDTPREFLVSVISNLFNKTKMNALAIAKKLEKQQSVICLVSTRDVAETKITEVTEYCFDSGYPLKCIMQKGMHNVIQKS